MGFSFSFFFFSFIIFNFIQTGKKELQSTSQVVRKTFGRLSLLKQKDRNNLRENLAATWATKLHSPLTQQKRQLRKDSLTHKMLLIILATDQSGEQSKEARGSSKLSHHLVDGFFFFIPLPPAQIEPKLRHMKVKHGLLLFHTFRYEIFHMMSIISHQVSTFYTWCGRV